MTIFSLLFIILIVFSQIVLTPLAEKTLQTRILTAGKAAQAEVSLQTSPPVLLLLGQVDRVDAKASGVQIGQVRLQDVSLKGTNLRADLSAFLFDGRTELRSADTLEITGTVSEENVRELLQKRVDRLENIQVKIAPDKITATAQAKIAGRMADIDLEGTIVEDGGGLYFRMTKLNIRNAIVGKAVLGDFFGDILLTKFSALPFKVEVDRVILQDGQVVVKASRHNQ